MKRVAVASAILCFASFTIALSDEPPADSETKIQALVDEAALPPAPPSVEAARRQAELLHAAIHLTLQSVHQQYYREDEGLPLPAAVLKDVFAELEREQHVNLRWLVVEGQAMNTDHKPKTPFENEAVKVLKSGKTAFDRAENGVYRRAGSIELTNHCLKCHVPDRKSTENRTAGLIIAIPIEGK